MMGIGLLTSVLQALNPRYEWLPVDARHRALSVLDVGGEGRDGLLARRYLPRCRFTVLNVADVTSDARYAPYISEFIHEDLNQSGLAALAGRTFDYVICSHTIEHLENGLAIVDGLAALVAEGGHLYLEWPSVRSQHFPIKGVGLNFHDDPTHVRSFGLEEVRERLETQGLTILAAGPRRNRLRAAFAPLLFLKTVLRFRRIVLYDFWDWTGYADVIRAVRPAAGTDKAAG